MSKTRPKRFVTRKEMKVERLPWGPHDWLCRPDIVEAKHLMLVRVHMPRGKAHEFHCHPAMEEIIYVVEGKAEQWVGKEKRVLGPGEIAHIPPGVVHATHNAGNKVLRFLAILGPAKFKGPALVDMSADSTWKAVREECVESPSRRKPAKKRARKTATKAASSTRAKARGRASAKRRTSQSRRASR
jgi:quercetin dioxygenase-like cupin family protein